MSTSKKIFIVQNLTEKLKQAKALVLTDYQGLNVAQINKLREEVKNLGGEFEVVKNTLLRLAFKNARLSIPPDKLQGPTAALWAYEDEVAPLKALDRFIKQTDLPKIKCGFFDGALISLEKIKELASLPGRDELESKLLGILCSPAFGLVNVLEGDLRKLVLLLKAKSAQEGGEKTN